MVAIAAVEVPRAFLPALSVSSRPMARSSPQVAALDRVFADERVQELLRADWMAGIPEDRVPPGNRWCKRCDGGPRWCCLCPCHGCGLRECNCSCGVGDYELHPFLASWDSPWHTTGYRRDFVQGVRDLTEALRSIVDEECTTCPCMTVLQQPRMPRPSAALSKRSSRSSLFKSLCNTRIISMQPLCKQHVIITDT